jgi:hypothetical protein
MRPQAACRCSKRRTTTKPATSPGSYTLALSQAGNTPIPPTLADGFLQTENGNYTPSMYGGSSGVSFLDFNCNQRNSNCYVNITGSGLLGAPQPMPVALVVPALLIPIITTRRRCKHQEQTTN